MFRVIFIVEGLFEKSDSIGYDCVYQARELMKIYGKDSVTVLSRKFSSELYPEVNIGDIKPFLDRPEDFSDALVVYHYCDGWPDLDQVLKGFKGRLIVRWHNNTPPWFFAMRRQYIERTIRGFEGIVTLAKDTAAVFWCNSQFTVNQLAVLGVDPARCNTVYPGSRFLISNSKDLVLSERSDASSNDDAFSILFVGRVVPHKGHRHILFAARRLGALINKQIIVHFVGRLDVMEYRKELEVLSESLSVKMEIHSEISQPDLEKIYAEATCLLFLSEHEGFGLPVYEAVHMDLPVIALAMTAVKEIMWRHPLAVTRPDYDEIADFMSRLLDVSFRKRIVKWQREQISPLYTADVLTNQIVSALAGETKWSPPAASETRDLIENRTIPDVQPRAETATEIQGNFVTLYDISSYSTLISDAISFSEDDASAEERLVQIPFSRFARKGGRISEAGLLFDLARAQGHIVYGPFIALPKGRFHAEFNLSIATTATFSGPMTFDIYGGQRLLSSFSIYADEVSETWRPELDFETSSAVTDLEFRVHVDGWKNGLLTFNGVTIRKSTPLNEMTSYMPSILVNYTPKPDESFWHRMKRAWNGSLGGDEGSAKHEGDRMRDAKNWDSAVKAYRLYLSRRPKDRAIWVQLGNCYKELQRYTRARAAYDAALQINPYDPDTYLQIGHLLKLSGRKMDALAAYAIAHSFSQTAVHAKYEIDALSESITDRSI